MLVYNHGSTPPSPDKFREARVVISDLKSGFPVSLSQPQNFAGQTGTVATFLMFPEIKKRGLLFSGTEGFCRFFFIDTRRPYTC